MSNINFNTSNNTFRQLLGNGISYRVPPFQRDYSWTENEWDDLWQDILGLFEEGGEPGHYMGYLVLQSSDNKRFDIIDGQQRITTISILILAGLGHLKDLVTAGVDSERNEKRKEQLLGSYIGYLDPVSLVSTSKLVLNRHNDQFYRTYLAPLENLPQRGLNASERLLRKTFLWFKDKIKGRFGAENDSGTRLTAFIDSLVDKLFFTVITVTDELNAYKVFETLNARGVRLSATDLLKNYLFSIVSAGDRHEVEMKSIEDRWEHIVGLLGSESFPEFLRVFWNSRNKLVRKSDLFKTIRKGVSTRDTAFELLRNLDAFAEVYASIRDPGDGVWTKKEKRSLLHLRMFKVRQPIAMLLACYRQFFENDRASFSKILNAVATISFRYNVICNLQTHEQERLYNRIALRISNKNFTTAREVIDALRDVYPDDNTFKNAFMEKELKTTDSRNKKVVRYILYSIEKQRSGQDFDIESAIYSLEHILPENPSEEWSYIDDTKQDRIIYRLGNMTLLEAQKNRDVGNSSYEIKRDSYRQSTFQITQAVAEHYDTWDELKIEARQKKMADIAASIWRMD